MKKRYEDGEKEIRRLKRENADIHDEVKACANMFRTKESNDHQWLVNRVGFLARENERLTEKLTWTEKRLQQTAKEHGVNWLDSMLEYCRFVKLSMVRVLDIQKKNKNKNYSFNLLIGMKRKS